MRLHATAEAPRCPKGLRPCPSWSAQPAHAQHPLAVVPWCAHLPRARMCRIFMLRSSVFFELYSLSCTLCCSDQWGAQIGGVGAAHNGCWLHHSRGSAGASHTATASLCRVAAQVTHARPRPAHQPTCLRFHVVYFLADVAVVQLASSRNSLTCEEAPQRRAVGSGRGGRQEGRLAAAGVASKAGTPRRRKRPGSCEACALRRPAGACATCTREAVARRSQHTLTNITSNGEMLTPSYMCSA